jgi:hypothetical protein
MKQTSPVSTRFAGATASAAATDNYDEFAGAVSEGDVKHSLRSLSEK